MLFRQFGILHHFVGLYLSTTATIALLTHKAITISLHGPFFTWQIIFLGPFTFCFDVITLILLHLGFKSSSHAAWVLAAVITVIIIVCSSTTFAVYREANMEVEWGRSLEIIEGWDYLGNFMARGRQRSSAAFAIFCIVACPITLLRHAFVTMWQQWTTTGPKKGNLGRLQDFPFHRVPYYLVGFLAFGALFIPQEPWKHMTSTLLLDVTLGISAVIMKGNKCPVETDASAPQVHFGTNLGYSPDEDPFYITNLNDPIDPFIVSALEGIKFTNVVELVLESVRGDCYPFQEDGLLHQFIKENVEPAANATPLTTKNITPFIDSLSTHTLVWDGAWSLCPLTNKAMMGCIALLHDCLMVVHCGMVGLPMDFGAEIKGNAQYYQTCLAQVFREMNLATDLGTELLPGLNETIRNSTDQWRTSHVTGSSCLWDDHNEMVRRIGYDTVIDAEFIQRIVGPREFDTFQGYWDEYGLEFLWQYVNHIRERTPKDRMYLTWVSQVTHQWLPLNPAWEAKNYQPFTKDAPDTQWTDLYLNGVRETDDLVKSIILGFRERGLENETLFVIHGDHGTPFIDLKWQGASENPHNDPYRTSFILYNPNIKNPEKKKINTNVYAAAIPTTILDVLNHTNSFPQSTQQGLAMHYAANYEHAQSFIRPIKESIRFFLVNPGGTQWVLDNGKNLRIRFNLKDRGVYMADYLNDPKEDNPMHSWEGVQGLIADGAENKFGPGTERFLLDADRRHTYMKSEIFKRYGLRDPTMR